MHPSASLLLLVNNNPSSSISVLSHCVPITISQSFLGLPHFCLSPVPIPCPPSLAPFWHPSFLCPIFALLVPISSASGLCPPFLISPSPSSCLSLLHFPPLPMPARSASLTLLHLCLRPLPSLSYPPTSSSPPSLSLIPSQTSPAPTAVSSPLSRFRGSERYFLPYPTQVWTGPSPPQGPVDPLAKF